MIYPKTLRFVLLVGLTFSVGLFAQSDKPLRVICFGAHPDDPELRMAGVSALWGDKAEVKFVSLTNGDIGHWREAGGPLAIRRTHEVSKVAEAVGASSEVLDIHDGELMPTLENRKTIIRLIREWDADIVLSHRPNDYHPDHRYTAVLVQDAAFMVAVPFIVPNVKPLDKNPIFLYYTDRFQKPNPSTADVVVNLDPVIDQTVDALSIMESQFLEGGALGSEENLWDSEAEKQEKVKEMKSNFKRRYSRVANKWRSELVERFGEKKGKAIKHAIAFELCEYGRQASREELAKLFP
ncbi:PIG-L family deacetylase [Opitutia bacterium ISCC 51]|nr:PIG-L family deacetylase [Opitutae bacterium ISCC 51]QXD29874.1 PIG-L family deacetylase [Opitutae bacterium ISCC 52]